MILRNTASLRDMRQAASLQAWHFQQMLAKSEFTPFQRAYFLKEMAGACLTIAGETIEVNNLGSLMLEAEVQDMKETVEPPPAPPKAKRKPRTRNPRTKPQP